MNKYLLLSLPVIAMLVGGAFYVRFQKIDGVENKLQLNRNQQSNYIEVNNKTRTNMSHISGLLETNSFARLVYRSIPDQTKENKLKFASSKTETAFYYPKGAVVREIPYYSENVFFLSPDESTSATVAEYLECLKTGSTDVCEVFDRSTYMLMEILTDTPENFFLIPQGLTEKDVMNSAYEQNLKAYPVTYIDSPALVLTEEFITEDPTPGMVEKTNYSQTILSYGYPTQYIEYRIKLWRPELNEYSHIKLTFRNAYPDTWPYREIISTIVGTIENN